MLFLTGRKHLWSSHLISNSSTAGYFPIKLRALKEGSVVHARVPVYQITAYGKYAPLCTYMETLLTMVWYCSPISQSCGQAFDVLKLTIYEMRMPVREVLESGIRCCQIIHSQTRLAKGQLA